MRTIFLLPALLLGACRAQETLGNNAATSTPGTAAGEAGSSTSPGQPSPPEQAVQTATLTGLYESGPPSERSQLCVVDRAAGESRFGLVVRRAGGEGCGGAGAAVRAGNVLRLAMSGDEPCTIEARIEGTRVTFPAALPAGCAYYCSRGASFAGVTLDKTGGSASDAMRAEDLVGDRLCAG